MVISRPKSEVHSVPVAVRFGELSAESTFGRAGKVGWGGFRVGIYGDEMRTQPRGLLKVATSLGRTCQLSMNTFPSNPVRLRYTGITKIRRIDEQLSRTTREFAF